MTTEVTVVPQVVRDLVSKFTMARKMPPGLSKKYANGDADGEPYSQLAAKGYEAGRAAVEGYYKGKLETLEIELGDLKTKKAADDEKLEGITRALTEMTTNFELVSNRLEQRNDEAVEAVNLLKTVRGYLAGGLFSGRLSKARSAIAAYFSKVEAADS